MSEVLADLEAIQYGRNEPTYSPIPKNLIPIYDEYQKLKKSSLILQNLSQHHIKALGASSGACYGFTMSMADSELSPYKDNRYTTGSF